MLGPNGAGKTTLLRGMATVHPFSQGRCVVDGMDATRPAERTEIRRRLGYLPQAPAFAPRAKVFDAVDHLAVLKELGPRRRRRAEVVRVLEAVGLAERAGSRVGELSGGMLQRLGVAQALLGSPALVVLDEPSTGLDTEQRILLRSRISQLGDVATVVVSTHLIEEAAAFSQRLVVLDRGRIVFVGTPDALGRRARGQVWRSTAQPPSSASLAWRRADGTWRGIGPPPAGALADEPTAEDGYLLLVGRSGLDG